MCRGWPGDAAAKDPEAQLTVSDCHGAYVAFCVTKGWSPLSRNQFGPLVESLVQNRFGIILRHDVQVNGGTAQRGWNGLRVSTVASNPHAADPRDLLITPL